MTHVVINATEAVAMNAITFLRQGDRYAVYAGIIPDLKRIGFVQRGRGPRGWDAIDTASRQSSGFATRDAAAHWLLSRSQGGLSEYSEGRLIIGSLQLCHE